MVKNLPSNAGDKDSVPDWEIKSPHAEGQLSPHPTNTEPTCHSEYPEQFLKKDPKGEKGAILKFSRCNRFGSRGTVHEPTTGTQA